MNSTVFHYVFTHRSSISPWPKWMGVLVSYFAIFFFTPDKFLILSVILFPKHGDEINFIFGEPLNSLFSYKPAEVRLSERMISFWVNFARNGYIKLKKKKLISGYAILIYFLFIFKLLLPFIGLQRSFKSR